ncbi:MAG: hypothetical protein ACTHYO_10485 [Micrococcaceae bacterium]
MKTPTTMAAFGAAALLLTACGGEAGPEPSAPEIQGETTSPTPTPTVTAEEDTISVRGSQIMEVGQTSGVIDEEGNELVTFTVNSIEVSPECTGEYAAEPENGFFVMFDAEVDSDPRAEDENIDPGLIFNTAGYRVIDEDGMTLSHSASTAAAYECFPDGEMMPITFGAGERASGRVVFDVPVESGTLLMEIDRSAGLQWEWNY